MHLKRACACVSTGAIIHLAADERGAAALLLCSQLQLWQLLCLLCAFLMIQLTQWAYAVFCIINFNYLRWNVIWGCASEWVEVSKCVLEERARNRCAMNAWKTSAAPWRRLKGSAMSRSSFGTYFACLIEHFLSVSAVIKQQAESVRLAVRICLTPTKHHWR